MKKIRYMLFLALSCTSSVTLADDETYTLDETHLSIGFLVDHAGYARTLGMFTKASGSFKYDENKSLVSDIEIIIDTSSVFTNHDKRDSHLRSPDFLNVDQYPEMTFKASINDLKLNPGKIAGNLTLLGVTRPLILNARINKIDTYPFRVGLSKPMVIGVSATASFKRSDFGMNYAVKKKLVGDEIDLIIEFEARQQ
jgi:polyisoprenoid-binding protein YceI